MPGMLCSVTEVGVGPKKCDKLAMTNLADRWTKTNTRNIDGKVVYQKYSNYRSR